MPLIDVVDLTFPPEFGIAPLSFQVEAGAVLGIVGGRKSGKTSVLRAMAGLLEPARGSIRIAGVDIRTRPRDIQPAIGYMPDASTYLEDIRVDESMLVAASLHNIPLADRETIIAQALELADLVTRRTALMSELPPRLRRRGLLARTLIHNPEVVLLDEPHKGLEPEAQLELREMIKSLAGMGKAIVVTSIEADTLPDCCSARLELEEIV